MRASLVRAAAWTVTVAVLTAHRDVMAADCNANGVDDAEEIASGLARDCNLNSVPDDCDLDPSIAFSPGSTIDIAGAVTEPVIADLDGDGDLDAAVLRKAVSSISEQRPARLAILRNAGDGTFSVSESDLVDDPGTVLPGDFDADGDDDLAFAGQDVRILFNRGDGTFVDAPFVNGISGPRAEGESADLDSDGDLDIACFAGSALTIFLNDGNGRFAYRSQAGSFSFNTQSQLSMAKGDLDGNETIDFVVVVAGARWVLRNDGTATFVMEEETLTGPLRSGAVAAAPLDFDPHLDLVLGADWGMRVDLNADDGTFPFSAVFPVPGAVAMNRRTHVEVFAADPDQDVDVVLTTGGRGGTSPRPGSTAVLANDGDGNLRLAAILPIEGAGFATAHPADLDGDVDKDILIGNLDTGLLAVWRNESLSSVSSDSNRDRVPDECGGRPFLRGDTEGDGTMDTTDAIFVLDHLYRGGSRPRCLEASDANDDGSIDVSDPVFILNHLFLGGPPPLAPGPPPAFCGFDPAESPKLGCERSVNC